MAGVREALRGLARNQVGHRQFRRITLMPWGEGVAMPVMRRGEEARRCGRLACGIAWSRCPRSSNGVEPRAA